MPRHTNKVAAGGNGKKRKPKKRQVAAGGAGKKRSRSRTV